METIRLKGIALPVSRLCAGGCPAGEYGWDGWLGCVFGNDPKNKLTFLFGMQRPDSGTTWLARRLRNLVTTELL